MIRTHVVVDGSNIATEGRTLPSLRQLDDAVTAFMAEHEVDTITVVVDATFPNRIDQSERAEYEAALLAGELVTPPAGTIGRGDAFILQIAEKVDATVLSNDSFQELHATRPWVFEEGRLIGGKPVPGVGWVFALRTPVRGPVSRRTTREARSKDRPRSPEPRATNANDESQDRRRKEGSGRRGASSAKIDAPQKGERQKLEHTSSRKSSIILNEPLPFLEFVSEHPIGSALDGVVESFSSHGAYVRVGNALCYAPLKLLGNPAPRTARDVLKLGNVHTFAVFSIDTPRRGIDLALKASSSAAAAANAAASDDDRTPRGSARGATRGRNSAVRSDDVSSVSPAQSVRTASDAARDTSSHVDVVVGTPTQPHENAEEATMAVKKAPAKKAAAKKAPARKTAAKKAPAKKAPAKKAPVRKAAAKKAPARKTAAKKTVAKKAPAKRTAAKKAVAKKTVAKKTVAKKAVAKKTVAKKAPARRTAAKKTVAKKAPAKRTAAKKTVAKKAPAKRTAAKKTVAKKAPARRTAAKKAPARKAAPRR